MTSASEAQRESLARLLAELRARDQRALERLYDSFGAMVHGVALRILGDAASAEEVSSDVFFALWQRPERYDPARGSLATWLILLARSRAIDRLRSRGGASRAPRAAEDPPAEPAGPGDAGDPDLRLIASEERERAQRLLARLNPDHRRVLELAYFGGMSHREIASHLERPLGTVKTWIRDALLLLRDAPGREAGP